MTAGLPPSHRRVTGSRTLADGKNAPRERSESLFGTVSEIMPSGEACSRTRNTARVPCSELRQFDAHGGRAMKGARTSADSHCAPVIGYQTGMLRPAGFIDPCLPTGARSVPSGPQWAYEIKHDGFRFICWRAGDRVRRRCE